MGGRSKQTFVNHTDGQKAHETMLNITNREMQIKTTVRDCLPLVRIPIIKKNLQMLQRVLRKGNPPTLLVGVNGTVTMHNGTR